MSSRTKTPYHMANAPTLVLRTILESSRRPDEKTGMYRVLHDFEWGHLAQVSPNEIALDAKHPDRLPPDHRHDTLKNRMGVWHPKEGSCVSAQPLPDAAQPPTHRRGA
ncbi:MAG: hypothetical protein A3I61_09340 [Acidobacteria bacterium RIFCSPLOWO2_02_FULL_68_18]|nr:MAG: hypothetical protein A3I61_09340 [Acidobacteria bacterium RIFCSPLOWO2_02_FULL_68_18]OFW51089.1 MAG: hypothetical protein A3G77_15815 [Acidobacteria bacterium RIFCSPLOWO2_12_FULL_68_19]